MKDNGPKVSIKLSCHNCIFEKHDSYVVQGDSGFNVFCTHENELGKYIGDSTWDTPNWCPLRAEALERFIDDVKRT